MEVEAHCGFQPTGRQHLYLYGHPQHQTAADDDWWEYFPCPFCYIEVEVPFLADHLQEEHCFDTRNAVCPICADNLGTETSEHFRNQHTLLKRRKPSSKPSPEADKEAYEEDSYFEAHPYCCIGRQAPDSSPDPLLSQFVCSVAPPTDYSKPGDAEESEASPPSDGKRQNQAVMDDASKQDLEERLQRIEFVKQMVMTTIA